MPEGVPQVLRVFLLGGFRVCLADREVPLGAWRLRKAAAVVKLLALAPGFVLHRDQLLEALWPDLDPPAATNSLHQALHFARRTLEPGRGRRVRPAFLWWEGEAVHLGPPDAVWVDVAEFEAQAACGADPEALRRAFDLYRGELLPEDRYEDWAAAPREALRLRFQGVALILARAAASSGDLVLAERALRRALETDRALEEAHLELVRLYLKSGDRARAARQYAEMAAALREELGVEPGPKAQALLAQIGRQVPGEVGRAVPETQVSARLPAFLTSFVGRRDELAAVAELLRAHRMVTLVGAPGVGKTRLAVEAARRVRLAESVFVDLSAATPDTVAATLRNALRIPEGRQQADLEAVAEHLRGRTLLLVLDNCEHVLASSAGAVLALLEGTDGVRILATSRQALGVPGEAVYRVPPLAVPRASPEQAEDWDVTELRRFDAVALFVERAQLADPTLTLTGDNAGAIAELCRQLDGLPLAIELAAARAAAVPPATMVERLADRFRLLAGQGAARSARHRSLRAALDWSYELLGEGERRLFQRLSVFVGGCTLEAAEAVAADALPHEEVLDLLARLVDRSLVVVEEAPRGTVRYRLLETLRAYGEERLRESGLEGEARARHARFFRDLSERVAQALASADPGRWLELLDAEHENLRSAIRWAVVHDPETALRTVVALARYAEMRGRVAEVRAWGCAAVEAASEVPQGLRARALMTLGLLARLVGDLRDAVTRLEAARALCDPRADPVLLGHVLNELGVVAHIQGNYEEAAALAGHSLQLLRPSGDRRGLATALNLLGLCAHHKGDFDTAREYLTETLGLARELGDRRIVAVALNNLGSIALYRRDYPRAWELFHEALAIQRKLGNRRSVANLLSNLGDTARGLGQHAKAAEMHRQALAERAAMKDGPGIATSLLNLAYVAAATGELERAAVLLAAGDRVRGDVGMALPSSGQAEYDEHLERVRCGLGGAFAEAWARGRAMTDAEAVAYALGAP